MESKYSGPKFSPIKSLNPISGAIRPSYTAVCLQSPQIQKFTLLNAKYSTEVNFSQPKCMKCPSILAPIGALYIMMHYYRPNPLFEIFTHTMHITCATNKQAQLKFIENVKFFILFCGLPIQTKFWCSGFMNRKIFCQCLLNTMSLSVLL